MTKKIFIYDYPKVITQKFKVDLPGRTRVFVTRKKIIKQQHNMGCTDGMGEGETSTRVDYEVHQEVDRETWEKAIAVVKREVKE